MKIYKLINILNIFQIGDFLLILIYYELRNKSQKERISSSICKILGVINTVRQWTQNIFARIDVCSSFAYKAQVESCQLGFMCGKQSYLPRDILTLGGVFIQRPRSGKVTGRESRERAETRASNKMSNMWGISNPNTATSVEQDGLLTWRSAETSQTQTQVMFVIG